jgi:subtilisin family serine protease
MVQAEPSVAPVAPAAPGAAGRILAFLSVLGIIVVSFLAQGIAWGGAFFGLPADSPFLAFGATLLQSFFLIAPLALFAFIATAPRYRSMFRTWLVAALALGVLSPMRLLPPAESQFAYLLQAVILALIFLILRWRVPVRAEKPASGVASVVGAGLGLLTGLPWIRAGSLGSPLDVLLALVLAVFLGLAAAHIITRFWLQPLQMAQRSPRRDYFTGGVVVGATWLILAAGVGINGMQLALMIALPALGWAAMGIASLGAGRAQPARRSAVALLATVAAWSCLAFVDSDGMALIIGDSILGDALRASLLAAFIGWVIGLVMGIGIQKAPEAGSIAQTGSLSRAWSWFIVPAVALFAAGAVYATGGQTGSHGDRLFVVMRDQADVSTAAQIEDYGERRRFVYETLVAQADRTQAPLRAALDRFGVAYAPYYLVNGLEVSGGLPMRWWLATRSDVAHVMPSPGLRPSQSELVATPGSLEKPLEPQWNLTSIGAPQVWEELGATGQGIVIGQSDSGAQYDHPELADSYRGRAGNHDYDWYDPWYGEPSPVDYGGHGTHTLGSVLGNSVGVAPDATWIACANLPRNLGNAARYLDCLQFMLAPFPLDGDPFRDGDPTLSAHVLNNSWGCPQEYEGCDPESLQPAVAALRNAGIFVVASAGNDGPACSTLNDPIALYDESFTIGAVDEGGDLASFSSRGPVLVDGSGRVKPDLVAPGVDILSAFPESTYEINSGTSMAGPHVAGVVALMWSANPRLIGDIERTEQILIETARPFTGASPGLCGETGGETPSNTTGYGVVDAYRAVKQAVAER